MRVFLSCVISEFKSYRLKMANQLGALKHHPFEVKVQEELPAGRLHSARQIGRLRPRVRSRYSPCGGCLRSPAHVEHIRALFHSLGEEPPDPLPEWSYTQWVYQLARRFHRAMLVISGPQFASAVPGVPRYAHHP